MATRLYSYYGKEDIVEPSSAVLHSTLMQVSTYATQSVAPGIYHDKKLITHFLHCIYSFVDQRLSRIIRRISKLAESGHIGWGRLKHYEFCTQKCIKHD